jgi:hypothetical protein
LLFADMKVAAEADLPKSSLAGIEALDPADSFRSMRTDQCAPIRCPPCTGKCFQGRACPASAPALTASARRRITGPRSAKQILLSLRWMFDRH